MIEKKSSRQEPLDLNLVKAVARGIAGLRDGGWKGMGPLERKEHMTIARRALHTERNYIAKHELEKPSGKR